MSRKQADKTKMQSNLQVLGLSGGATEDDVRRQYKKLALLYHPDKNPDDPKAKERFQELSHAYMGVMKEFQKKWCPDCNRFHDLPDECEWSDEDYEEDEEDEDMTYFYIFMEVLAEYIRRRRFEKRYSVHRYFDYDNDSDSEEEESFLGKLRQKLRSFGRETREEEELTEEDLKRFHSYEEWFKNREPRRSRNHKARKARRKAMMAGGSGAQAKTVSKKQQKAEQCRRKKEMEEIKEQLQDRVLKDRKKDSADGSSQPDSKGQFKSFRQRKEELERAEMAEVYESRAYGVHETDTSKPKYLEEGNTVSKKERRRQKKREKKARKRGASREDMERMYFSKTHEEEEQKQCYSRSVPTRLDGEPAHRYTSLISKAEEASKVSEGSRRRSSNSGGLLGGSDRWSPEEQAYRTQRLEEQLKDYQELMKVQPPRHTEHQLQQERKLARERKQQEHDEELQRLREESRRKMPDGETDTDADLARRSLQRLREMELCRNQEEIDSWGEQGVWFRKNKEEQLPPFRKMGKSKIPPPDWNPKESSATHPPSSRRAWVQLPLPPRPSKPVVDNPLSEPVGFAGPPPPTSTQWTRPPQIKAERKPGILPANAADEDAMLREALRRSMETLQQDEARRRQKWASQPKQKPAEKLPEVFCTQKQTSSNKTPRESSVGLDWFSPLPENARDTVSEKSHPAREESSSSDSSDSSSGSEELDMWERNRPHSLKNMPSGHGRQTARSRGSGLSESAAQTSQAPEPAAQGLPQPGKSERVRTTSRKRPDSFLCNLEKEKNEENETVMQNHISGRFPEEQSNVKGKSNGEFCHTAPSTGLSGHSGAKFAKPSMDTLDSFSEIPFVNTLTAAKSQGSVNQSESTSGKSGGKFVHAGASRFEEKNGHSGKAAWERFRSDFQLEDCTVLQSQQNEKKKVWEHDESHFQPDQMQQRTSRGESNSDSHLADHFCRPNVAAPQPLKLIIPSGRLPRLRPQDAGDHQGTEGRSEIDAEAMFSSALHREENSLQDHKAQSADRHASSKISQLPGKSDVAEQCASLEGDVEGYFSCEEGKDNAELGDHNKETGAHSVGMQHCPESVNKKETVMSSTAPTLSMGSGARIMASGGVTSAVTPSGGDMLAAAYLGSNSGMAPGTAGISAPVSATPGVALTGTLMPGAAHMASASGVASTGPNAAGILLTGATPDAVMHTVTAPGQSSTTYPQPLGNTTGSLSRPSASTYPQLTGNPAVAPSGQPAHPQPSSSSAPSAPAPIRPPRFLPPGGIQPPRFVPGAFPMMPSVAAYGMMPGMMTPAMQQMMWAYQQNLYHVMQSQQAVLAAMQQQEALRKAQQQQQQQQQQSSAGQGGVSPTEASQSQVKGDSGTSVQHDVCVSSEISSFIPTAPSAVFAGCSAAKWVGAMAAGNISTLAPTQNAAQSNLNTGVTTSQAYTNSAIPSAHPDLGCHVASSGAPFPAPASYLPAVPQTSAMTSDGPGYIGGGADSMQGNKAVKQTPGPLENTDIGTFAKSQPATNDKSEKIRGIRGLLDRQQRLEEEEFEKLSLADQEALASELISRYRSGLHVKKDAPDQREKVGDTEGLSGGLPKTSEVDMADRVRGIQGLLDRQQRLEEEEFEKLSLADQETLASELISRYRSGLHMKKDTPDQGQKVGDAEGLPGGVPQATAASSETQQVTGGLSGGLLRAPEIQNSQGLSGGMLQALEVSSKGMKLPMDIHKSQKLLSQLSNKLASKNPLLQKCFEKLCVSPPSMPSASVPSVRDQESAFPIELDSASFPAKLDSSAAVPAEHDSFSAENMADSFQESAMFSTEKESALFSTIEEPTPSSMLSSSKIQDENLDTSPVRVTSPFVDEYYKLTYNETSFARCGDNSFPSLADSPHLKTARHQREQKFPAENAGLEATRPENEKIPPRCSTAEAFLTDDAITDGIGALGIESSSSESNTSPQRRVPVRTTRITASSVTKSQVTSTGEKRPVTLQDLLAMNSGAAKSAPNPLNADLQEKGLTGKIPKPPGFRSLPRAPSSEGKKGGL